MTLLFLAIGLGAGVLSGLFGIGGGVVIVPALLVFALQGRIDVDASAPVVAASLLGGQLGAGTVVVTLAVPALIEPALRVGHRLADTPVPAALVKAHRPPVAEAVSP